MFETAILLQIIYIVHLDNLMPMSPIESSFVSFFLQSHVVLI